MNTRRFLRARPPKLRVQVQRALDLGLVLRLTGSGHAALVRPEGGPKVFVLASTPSDRRTVLNEASQLRKALDQLEAP